MPRSRCDRLRNRVGLDGCRLHDVRHCVATRLLGAGVGPRTVVGRLGHANPDVTMTVCGRILPEKDRAAADFLDDVLRRDGWGVAVIPSCSYNRDMAVATSRVEVGVRDLKNNLSRYLDRVREGEEVIVTDRGRPVARLSALDHATDRLAELVAAGVVRPAKRTARTRPARRIKPKGPVSDLVAEQRR